MVAYGEFRRPFRKDDTEHRIVYTGMRYIIANYVAKPWTRADVRQLQDFLQTHNAATDGGTGASAFPFPADLFERAVREHGGYMPVRVRSLPEGTVVYPHTVLFEISANDEWSRLVTFLESLLTMVWGRQLRRTAAARGLFTCATGGGTTPGRAPAG
ncbi:hypothetical protein H696_06344 [Fonticula alba]|uniref:Uncharacterized protein n=1 Tax=Fonticula alba TaxID=691883 RepID=A0A058YZ17_FONAL|nr:hypothetical protein H696_06344 [Fonticula alba]KCV67234.1 hypothetical protein H696_06344 [Fonticula alba]|eukprot:XP_009498361.1 hypothetical protein H696_06344 [Fonticula alba]